MTAFSPSSTSEAAAIAHLERAVRVAATLPVDAPAPLTINRAAVLGAGTMGAGIAICYAAAKIPVLVYDPDQAALARGLATIEKHFESAVSRGRLSRADADESLARIGSAASLDALGDVDIVVEAAFEDLALKRRIFETLGHVTPSHAVLATNTSTLDIDEMAEASGRPSQVVGHHFFSPAHVMKLLEIVRGRQTSAEVVATSQALAARLGKVGVVVGNCFGFVANRLLAYYMREAYLLLEEGATVDAVDRAMTTFGMPVGPFAMQDLVGLDVGARIRQHAVAMGKTRADGPQSEVPDRLFELGRYGQKTSAGWYRYEPGSRMPIVDPLVNEVVAASAARRGITRRASIPDEEIVSRITTAVINEGCRVLDEGYAARPGDIDVIYCYGFGFPRARGGPMYDAERVGLAEVLRRVREYRARFGSYWTPAVLLERLVANGEGLYEESR